MAGKNKIKELLEHAELFDFAGVAVAITDPDGKWLFCNRYFCDLLGYSPEDFTELKSSDVTHPDDIAKTTESINYVKKELRPYRIEKRYITKDGKTVWIDLSVTPITDGSGQLLALMGAGSDITEKKRQERELHLQTEWHGLIADNTMDVIYRMRLSPERGFEFVSPSCEKITGYTAEEHYQNPDLPISIIHPDDREEFKKYQTISTQLRENKTFRCIHKDGHVFWVEINSVPVFDVNGSVIAIEGISRDVTDRVLAEKRVADSEKRLMSVFRAAPVGTGIVADRVFTMTNDRLCSMTGYTEEELIGQSSRMLYTTDDEFERVGDDKYAQINQTGTGTVETLWQRKNGEVIDVLLSSTVLDPEDRSKGVTFTALDITERKNAERALLEQESRLKAAIESMPFDFFMLDREGRYSMQNTISKDLWGNLVGTRPEDIAGISPETFDLWLDNNRRAYSGEVVAEDVSFVAGGRLSHFHNIISPIWHSGEVIGILGANIDLTERMKAEEELARSEEMFRAIAESAEDSIFVKDTDFKFTFVNPAMEKALGLPAEELVGKTPDEIFEEEDAKKIKNVDEPVLKGVPTNEVETLVIEGEERTFHAVQVPLTDSKGEIFGIAGIVREVTTQKRMEEELQKSQRLESLGVLAGGIAHDFNNILTGLFGNIELARMKMEVGHEALRNLEEASKAYLRARDLTMQLLTFSKGGAPVTRPASITEIVKESAEFVLRGSNASIKMDIAPEVSTVEVDPGQISQVIGNLVINAEQAMPSGEIRIELANHHMIEGPLPKGDYVRISVIDQGVGIKKENLEKIFDPFFTTKQKGSGLGLATSYSIIKRHNGSISAESTPGEGSAFHVLLPASAAAPEKEMAQKRPLKEMGHGRILIMDDEEQVRHVVAKMLRKLGHTTDYAEHGDEALRKYKEARENGEPYRLVIMDLTVPGAMGGEEAIKKLLDMDPEARAIVASGYSTDPVMADYMSHGFKAVVSKPFTFDSLSEAVRKALRED